MRAAVTGIGVVTPAGVGVEEFVDHLRHTRQRLSTLHDVPTPRGKAAVGLVHDRRFRRIDRAYRLALTASREAVRHRGGDLGGTETALLVSTLAADSDAAEHRYAEFQDGGIGTRAVKHSLK